MRLFCRADHRLVWSARVDAQINDKNRSPAHVDAQARRQKAIVRPTQTSFLITSPADVGQPEVAALEAEGQLGVVEAEQVQDRRLQVVDVDAVLDRREAELVGLADDLARLRCRRRPCHMV